MSSLAGLGGGVAVEGRKEVVLPTAKGHVDILDSLTLMRLGVNVIRRLAAGAGELSMSLTAADGVVAEVGVLSRAFPKLGRGGGR